MPRPSRESIMSTLFNALIGSLQASLTVSTTAGNPVLGWTADSNLVTADSTLAAGDPIFGWTADSGSVRADSGIAVSGSGLQMIFVGLPVFGPGIARGTVISSVSPLTLSIAPTVSAESAHLTTGFLTFGRRFQFWNQVSAQPALFLRDGDEDFAYHQTSLQEQIMKAEVWIYSNAGANPDIAPITPLNNLLDAVQATFAPDDRASNRFTLGGLVYWCRMSGKVEKDPGDASGQAIAVIDVEIIVP